MTARRDVSRSASLRIGFGVVLGLLFASTITAWWIQESLSERSIEISRRYFHQQDRLNRLRRVLWAAGGIARDYFLNPNPDRSEVYFTQIRELRDESETLFLELTQFGIPELTTRELRTHFHEMWKTLDQLRYTTFNEPPGYAFIQQEIIPRRESAAAALRRIEQAVSASLTQREAEFDASRVAAARNLLIMLGICGMLAAFVATRSIRYSEKLERQGEQQLEEVSRAKQELERLSARLMDVQEEERTRIARELHDEIVQNLAVLKMEITQAEAVPPDRAAQRADRLARAREIAERTIKTLRNIMQLLRPSMLDDLGLGAALQWLTDDSRRRTGAKLTYAEQGLEEDLPDAVKTCVYRVVQEALHNCEKHAKASEVRVRIQREPDSLTAEIRDNGVGFDSRPDGRTRRGQFGLLGMRERATAIGGTLNIDSAPGRGTTVTLRVPLPPPAGSDSLKYQETHV